MASKSKIDYPKLNTFLNDIKTEESSFNNNSMSTFKNSYLCQSGDSTVATMGSKLNEIYNNIVEQYNKTNNWFSNYLDDLNKIEMALSNNGGVSGITESLVKSHVLANLDASKLVEYKPELTKFNIPTQAVSNSTLAGITQVQTYQTSSYLASTNTQTTNNILNGNKTNFNGPASNLFSSNNSINNNSSQSLNAPYSTQYLNSMKGVNTTGQNSSLLQTNAKGLSRELMQFLQNSTAPYSNSYYNQIPTKMYNETNPNAISSILTNPVSTNYGSNLLNSVLGKNSRTDFFSGRNSLNNHKDDLVRQLQINQLKKDASTLRSIGIMQDDINRILDGETNFYDLINEIETDPDNSRRRLMNEVGYLQNSGLNFSSLDDLNNNIKDLSNQYSNLLETKFSQDSLKVQAELYVLNTMSMGFELDSILTGDNTRVTKWEDMNGQVHLTSEMEGIPYDAKNIETVKLVDFLDESFLNELKAASATQVETGLLWNKSSRIEFKWTGSERQLALYDRLTKEYEQIQNGKEGLDKKIDELNAEILRKQAIYDAINSQVNYQMNNIDQYMVKKDFIENSRFNKENLNHFKEYIAEDTKNSSSEVKALSVDNKEAIVLLAGSLLNGNIEYNDNIVVVDGQRYKVYSD